jgi:hypothetical protein
MKTFSFNHTCEHLGAFAYIYFRNLIMDLKLTPSTFNDLKTFVVNVNIDNMTDTSLAVRVRDILNRDKNRGGGHVSLRQALNVARAIKGLVK